MALRLWLDDYRRPPFGYDLWAKTAEEAIEYLESDALIDHCSLDHDLAEEHYADSNAMLPIDRSKYKTKTGLEVVIWMVRTKRWVPSIYIHTMNEMGAHEMITLIRVTAPPTVRAELRDPKDTRPPERT